jgi:hypothetical protein
MQININIKIKYKSTSTSKHKFKSTSSQHNTTTSTSVCTGGCSSSELAEQERVATHALDRLDQLRLQRQTLKTHKERKK